MLIHRRLGNTALIALLRTALVAHLNRFPLLLGKVLYDGTHCGDFIEPNSFPSLEAELRLLHEVRCPMQESQEFVAEFFRQMSTLVEAAKSVQKPIVF